MTFASAGIGAASRRRRIYLMRHGEVEYFTPEGHPLRPETVHLSELGQTQANAACAAFQNIPLDRAITSGLPRTQQTAERVLLGRSIPLEQDTRLREMETGRLEQWAAGTPQQVEALFLGALASPLTPESRFLAGETFASLSLRLSDWWTQIQNRRDWTTLLVVAHGVVNRWLLGHVCGTGLTALGSFEQDAGCINLLEVDETGQVLVRLVNFSPVSPLKLGMSQSTLEGLYEQYLRGLQQRSG